MRSGGDCYEASGKYIMDECMFGDDCKLLLVHGEVSGQGTLEGLTYGHAWVLDGDLVIDRSNGRFLEMPKQLYYTLGQIDHIDNMYVYSWKEARQKILEFEHWGPWDLETRSGL